MNEFKKIATALGTIVAMLPREGNAQAAENFNKIDPNNLFENALVMNDVSRNEVEKGTVNLASYSENKDAELKRVELEKEKATVESHVKKAEAEYQQLVDTYLATLKKVELYLLSEGKKKEVEVCIKAETLPVYIQKLVTEGLASGADSAQVVDMVMGMLFVGNENADKEDKKNIAIAEDFSKVLQENAIGSTIVTTNPMEREAISNDIQYHQILGNGWKDQIIALIQINLLQKQAQALEEELLAEKG